MNKKNLLIIGAVVLVAFGVWFYFDSLEDVGLGPGSCGPAYCSCSGNSCTYDGLTARCYNWNENECEGTICRSANGNDCDCKTESAEGFGEKGKCGTKPKQVAIIE